MLTSCKHFLGLSLAVASFSVCSLRAQVLIPASAPVRATTVTAPAPGHELPPPTGRLFNLSIKDGMLVVDGWVAKARLNYGIHKQGYLYFFVPGVGTTVVSLEPMPGAETVRGAFNGRSLDFTLSGHTFQLTSQRNLRPAGADIYVKLDPSTLYLDTYPMIGFGQTTQAPYNWPPSAVSPQDNVTSASAAPPLPPSMLPRVEH